MYCASIQGAAPVGISEYKFDKMVSKCLYIPCIAPHITSLLFFPPFKTPVFFIYIFL